MRILPFRSEHITEAARLFVASFRRQRQTTPAMPDTMAHPEHVENLLDRFLTDHAGVVALEGNRLAGYMTWLYADRFRGTDRAGAYCPEWAHAATDDGKINIYRALYRAASTQWAEAGCQVHAVTLLAHDEVAREAWFWNGFGLAVVDAVRPMRALDGDCVTDLRIRRATPEDGHALAGLDREHCWHYSAPPVFMAPRSPDSASDFAGFVRRPNNAIWLAADGERPVGFIRFDGHDSDKTVSVTSPASIYVTGAYVRPEYRGRKAAAAMLNAALMDYAGRGFACCAVDFESFNPEAASFWMRHFAPVCLSVMRAPEHAPERATRRA